MIDKETIEKIVRELGSGEGSPTFVKLWDDRTVWKVAGMSDWSKSFRGAAIRTALLQAVHSKLTKPFVMRVKRTVADGEMLVIEGKGDNELKAGGRYDNEYVLMCRFEGSRIAEISEYCDLDYVRRVLGPFPL